MEEHTAPGNSSEQIEVPLHPRAHPSDILTRYLLRGYGGEKYGSGASPLGPRVVMVGRGGYDEHDPENLPDPKQRECEATLVALDLGVRERPELQPLLNYIRGADLDGAGKGILKFARVVELLYDVYPDMPGRVEQFATVLFEASIAAERAASAGTPLAPVPPEVVSYFIRKAQALVTPEFRLAVRLRLEERIKPWLNPSGLVFESFGLPHCVTLLWQRFRKSRLGEKPVVEWVADAFRAELMKQSRFLDAWREIDRAAEAGEIDEALLTVRGVAAVAYLIRSDSPNVHSFLFSRDYKSSGENILVAVRRSNGQLQMFRRRHGAAVKVKLHWVAALLRAREQEKRGFPVSPWAELIAPRGPMGAECWFYRRGPEWIFNGALSAPDVEATYLTDGEILDCVTRGLDDSYREFRDEFRRARGG